MDIWMYKYLLLVVPSSWVRYLCSLIVDWPESPIALFGFFISLVPSQRPSRYVDGKTINQGLSFATLLYFVIFYVRCTPNHVSRVLFKKIKLILKTLKNPMGYFSIREKKQSASVATPLSESRNVVPLHTQQRSFLGGTWKRRVGYGTSIWAKKERMCRVWCQFKKRRDQQSLSMCTVVPVCKGKERQWYSLERSRLESP